MKPIPLEIGDQIEFEDGRCYTAQSKGHYYVTDPVVAFNGTKLNIDWKALTKDRTEALSQAIEDLRSRITRAS